MEAPRSSKMKLRKHGDWIQYITDHGKTFYYNEINGDFQWVPPITEKGKINYTIYLFFLLHCVSRIAIVFHFYDFNNMRLPKMNKQK